MKTRIFLATVMAAILTATQPPASHARRHTTISHRLKPATPADTVGGNIPAATVTVTDPDTSAIAIAGFDKPVDSRTESFFIINRTHHTLTGITVTLTYSDTSGRQLHQATHRVECDIPPGHTRQATVPSWDRQQSFYYAAAARLADVRHRLP